MIFSVPRETTWFELTARENFEKYLRFTVPPIPYFLQLGCFTGDASMWILENCPGLLFDVDTFEGSDEHEGYDFAEVERIYRDRVSVAGDRVMTFVDTTRQFLAENQHGGWDGLFDFIYVDADHHAKEVLRDAVMAWPLLKKGGLMAFDDYEWGQGMSALDTPRPGIDAFLTVYSPEIVVKNAQCWVRKG